MSAQPLLLEVLTEELPAKSVRPLGEALGQSLLARLDEENFTGKTGKLKVFATPRRLAALVEDVLHEAPPQPFFRRGPSVQKGLAGGKATAALTGFARSLGVTAEEVRVARLPDGEYFVYEGIKPGKGLASFLRLALTELISSLPLPKSMRWNSTGSAFLRPVRAVAVLWGKEVLPVDLFGLQGGRKTQGHRFMGEKSLDIPEALAYEALLEERGWVVADFSRRMTLIEKGLQLLADGREVLTSPELIEEAAGLTEWPVVEEGVFEEEFLEVPQEVLMTAMRHHQRYFPLAADGRLLPCFLFVANIKPEDPRPMRAGNERVLRARLADARFFWEQDRKTSLVSRVEKLAKGVFHDALGSQRQRVARLEALAAALAGHWQEDVDLAIRAAYLCKADLTTEMVGEFPELEGIMGKYYALHDGEAKEVVQAIFEHLLPRHGKDALPESRLGALLGIADRIDTLVGFFGAGLSPTGEKDPFALRRKALALARLVVEKELDLDLNLWFSRARDEYLVPLPAFSPETLLDFVAERARWLFRELGFRADRIESVLSLEKSRLLEARRRIEALSSFPPDGLALAIEVDKRLRNMLRSAPEGFLGVPKTDFFSEKEETALWHAGGKARSHVQEALARGDHGGALFALASLAPVVGRFFDAVLVMSEDESVRQNRLALLAQTHAAFRAFADFSKLEAG